MTHKQLHITLLSGLFVFTAANSAQQPSLNDQITKQGLKIVGQQTNELFNIGREKLGLVSVMQKAQQENYQYQTQLSIKQIEGQEQQIGINAKTEMLTDLQIKEHQHTLFAQQMTEYQTLKNLDPENPDLPNMLKAIKLANKTLNNYPEPEETKKPELDKPTNNDEQKNNGFLAYCFLAAVAAKDAVDVIADCSFKNITDLDCFKNTFVDKHHIGINRVLVLTTITVLTYKGYSLYKKYMAQRNEKDEDIFNDDLD